MIGSGSDLVKCRGVVLIALHSLWRDFVLIGQLLNGAVR